MTWIKILPLLIFLVSCGKDVKISNKLESASMVTQGGTSTDVQNSGVLIRMSSSAGYDQIQYNGQTYKVSMYSAYNALEFIAAKPLGTTLTVSFKGKVVNQEILLQEIQ